MISSHPHFTHSNADVGPVQRLEVIEVTRYSYGYIMKVFCTVETANVTSFWLAVLPAIAAVLGVEIKPRVNEHGQTKIPAYHPPRIINRSGKQLFQEGYYYANGTFFSAMVSTVKDRVFWFNNQAVRINVTNMPNTVNQRTETAMQMGSSNKRSHFVAFAARGDKHKSLKTKFDNNKEEIKAKLLLEANQAAKQ